MGIAVAVLMSILGVIGDYFLRIAGDGQHYVEWKWFAAGILLYALTAIGWFYAFKHMQLAMVGVVYSLTTIVLLTLLGTLYFHEKLSLIEGVSIVLSIIVIAALSRFA